MIKKSTSKTSRNSARHNVDAAMKVFGEWNKGWQAIAAEMTDYTKRSFEESTATFEKLLSAKSVEQAIEIQTRLRQARLRRLHAPDVEDRRHVCRARQGSLQAGREGDAERALSGDAAKARMNDRARGRGSRTRCGTRLVRARSASGPFFVAYCSFDTPCAALRIEPPGLCAAFAICARLPLE